MKGTDAVPAGERVLTSDTIVLGAYRVERQIGEGGFGRVYEAKHLASDRRVALKIGRRWEHGERLLREARMAAMLESPHAVRVLDVGHLDDGCPIIVLEFLEGTSLREYLKKEVRVPPALAVHWSLQLLAVLGEAHERSLVHRDLKPSNLFLVHQGAGAPELKLLDFGLARAPHRAGEASVTGSDLVVGSPAYMSPEQIRGDTATVQSDIWAFGVVLYEMLAGARPFQGETNAAVVASIVADPPLPWKESQHAVDLRLRRIVAQCLRKSLAERPRSVHDIAHSLREALGHLQVGADDAATTLSIPMLPPREGGTKGTRRKWALGAVFMAAVLALIGWGGGGAARTSSVHVTQLPLESPRTRTEGLPASMVRPADARSAKEPSPPSQAPLDQTLAEESAMPAKESAPPRRPSHRQPNPDSPTGASIAGSEQSRDGAKGFFAEPDF